MRAQQHSDIQSLMKSNLDQEADLSEARLKAEDCIAKEQLEGNRRRINQLEAEKHQLQEAIAAQQFQIRKLQYTGKEILAKAGEDHPVRAVTQTTRDMHKQIAWRLQVAPVSSNTTPPATPPVVTRQALQVHPGPKTLSVAATPAPIAQAIPLDLVQASAGTKLPAPKTQTSRDRKSCMSSGVILDSVNSALASSALPRRLLMRTRRKLLVHQSVWRWWQDPKEMEKLQPPSVSRILMDPNFSQPVRADLSLMVENIAEAMSCKAAMRMAFRLGTALPEQLEGNRRRISQLEAETSASGSGAAQQFQIQSPQPHQVREAAPIARDEQKSIIHLPQILAKAERIIRSGWSSGALHQVTRGHAQADRKRMQVAPVSSNTTPQQLLQSSDRQALQVHPGPKTLSVAATACPR
ncbi:hypothetical protein DPEC_G00362120 [Dallia pectoralis]|nr:hypothetical protein DPEC_G00362120 [Dallia pectoralis]